MKKVLILGNTDSVWTKSLVDNFLMKENYEVWMIRMNKTNENEYFRELYEKKGIHFINCTQNHDYNYDRKIKKNYLLILYNLILETKKNSKIKKFDIINLHFVDFKNLFVAFILKIITGSKLIISYWGSDLLRINNFELFICGWFVRFADYITFDNMDLENKFKDTYKWGCKMRAKTVLFGLPVLDIIKTKCKKESPIEIRERWGIPENKKVIAVGYNGIPQQQHIKVLKSLRRMKKDDKEKIFLLLQMTYNGTEKYKKDVIAEVKKTECEYMVIQRFLTDYEVADLRIITDIFINAQVTDAFSGSVCENLFSNTLLINAKWLCYQEFQKFNFTYLEFDNISDINKIIEKSLDCKIDFRKNAELIWKLRSWESCRLKWKDVYHRVSG